MKILLIGSGGREHALVWKLAASPKVTKIFAAPGNAGMESSAECVDIDAMDISGLLSFAKENAIDLTVVGPEAPLVEGITDTFEKEGLKVCGPSKYAALLEGSKIFSKQKMDQYGIPTASYKAFQDPELAKAYIQNQKNPMVVKADGLAAGKGVFVCQNTEEALDAIKVMMEDLAFGDAGKRVLVEETLEGEEVSVFVFTDGEKILPLPSSQDHKRVFDGDLGPNTGGMGAYSPYPKISDAQVDELIELAVRPLIEGFKAEGKPYRGVLYTGIMLTPEGPKVLEYNCRFGDPEAQVLLPRLKNDLFEIMNQIAEGNLAIQKLEWDSRFSLGVVLASGGYPGSYEKGFAIEGINNAESDESTLVFHAGTKKNPSGDVVTSGGRVLLVVNLAGDLQSAYEGAYKAVEQIKFDHVFFRRDIGSKSLEVINE